MMDRKKTSVRPAANEPGTIQQQMDIIAIAIAMADGTEFTRREFWEEARKQILPHARGDQ